MIVGAPGGRQRLVYIPPDGAKEPPQPYEDDGRSDADEWPAKPPPQPSGFDAGEELPPPPPITEHEIPMAVDDGEERPTGRVARSLFGDRPEGTPLPVPDPLPDAVRSMPRGSFATSYVGPRPRAKTMAESQAHHPSNFGAPGSPGEHPEFEDGRRLRMVQPGPDGEPTYSRDEEVG
jgi:hypothetical protein